MSIQTSNWFTKLQFFGRILRTTPLNMVEHFSQTALKGLVAVHVENATFQSCRSRQTGGSIALFSSKEIHFGARHTTWNPALQRKVPQYTLAI